MQILRPIAVILCGLAACGTSRAEDGPGIPQALKQYVARPDAAYRWTLEANHAVESGKFYDLRLTSQTWQDITWTHNLRIIEPARIRHPQHMLLFITGGRTGDRPRRGDTALGVELARAAGARVAILWQVPNQPLLGDRFEDDLITDTWLRFLETGDPDWPLLFPMVKSAVKAMDALEEFAAAKLKTKLRGFVVTGASKRGWTTWLSAAADQRVVGIAPMVIDTLNFQPQMRYQLDTWGKFSEQIDDYTRKGLVKLEDETPREIQLRTWMDPYTYRSLLGLPKLMINGTNDPYWVVDALNNYWDGLIGPKAVLYVPNAGHSLKGGEKQVVAALGAFFQHVVTGRPLPKMEWQYDARGSALTLSIRPSTEPLAARLWLARSPTKDFRTARWESTALKAQDDGTFHGRVELPETGHIALFGELEFGRGAPYSLCTPIRRE